MVLATIVTELADVIAPPEKASVPVNVILYPASASVPSVRVAPMPLWAAGAVNVTLRFIIR